MNPYTIYALAVSALGAAGLLAWALYDSLFPIFLGFGLAYAFGPCVDWLVKRGLARAAAVSLIMGGAAGVVLLALALVIPGLVREAGDLALNLPNYLKVALDRLSAAALEYGIPFPAGREELLVKLRERIGTISWGALSPFGSFAARFFSGAAGMLVGVLNLLVVPVVFYYFLLDMPRIRKRVLELAPPGRRAALSFRLGEADRVFSGYLRGQMSVALILAGLYAVGLALVGIRFGVVIGVAAGLLNIVPYVGVLTGLVLSLIMAAVDQSAWTGLAGVLAVFGVCQVLEGFYITPKIVGDKVGLSPMETIIALILGGELGGLLGLVLAIPVAGCLKVYAGDALDFYRETAFYREG